MKSHCGGRATTAADGPRSLLLLNELRRTVLHAAQFKTVSVSVRLSARKLTLA